jgi:hypothetical protein
MFVERHPRPKPHAAFHFAVQIVVPPKTADVKPTENVRSASQKHSGQAETKVIELRPRARDNPGASWDGNGSAGLRPDNTGVCCGDHQHCDWEQAVLETQLSVLSTAAQRN